jgi:deoxyribonuclease IV
MREQPHREDVVFSTENPVAAAAPVVVPIRSAGPVDEDAWQPEPVAPVPIAAWRDGSFRVGIHASIAGDIANSLDIAHKLGCNALQIFSTSPRMWPRPGRSRIADADAARFLARRLELKLGPVAIHANYLINLAAADPMARVRTIQAFREELVRAISLGADFLIVHPGSARDGNMAKGVAAIAEAIRQSVRGLKGMRGKSSAAAADSNPGLTILIENTAGMGNSVGSRFEELAAIRAGVADVEIGVCLDTAHMFEAGYPIHTVEGLEATIAQIDATIGLDQVKVLHVNDSKTEHGSCVDRHEHLGRGKIGMEALERVMRHPALSPQRVAGRAFLLETPIDEPGDDRRNVAALWKLVGVAVEQAPDAVDGFSMVVRKRKVILKVAPKSRIAPKVKSKAVGRKGSKSAASRNQNSTAKKSNQAAPRKKSTAKRRRG